MRAKLVRGLGDHCVVNDAALHRPPAPPARPPSAARAAGPAPNTRHCPRGSRMEKGGRGVAVPGLRKSTLARRTAPASMQPRHECPCENAMSRQQDIRAASHRSLRVAQQQQQQGIERRRVVPCRTCSLVMSESVPVPGARPSTSATVTLSTKAMASCHRTQLTRQMRPLPTRMRPKKQSAPYALLDC